MQRLIRQIREMLEAFRQQPRRGWRMVLVSDVGCPRCRIWWLLRPNGVCVDILAGTCNQRQRYYGPFEGEDEEEVKKRSPEEREYRKNGWNGPFDARRN